MYNYDTLLHIYDTKTKTILQINNILQIIMWKFEVFYFINCRFLLSLAYQNLIGVCFYKSYFGLLFK